MEYSPVSVGKLRLWITLTHAMDMMKSLGNINFTLNFYVEYDDSGDNFLV